MCIYFRHWKDRRRRVYSTEFKSNFRRPTALHEWEKTTIWVLELCDPSYQTILKGMNFHDMEWCTVNISFPTKWLPVLHVFSHYIIIIWNSHFIISHQLKSFSIIQLKRSTSWLTTKCILGNHRCIYGNHQWIDHLHFQWGSIIVYVYYMVWWWHHHIYSMLDDVMILYIVC